MSFVEATVSVNFAPADALFALYACSALLLVSLLLNGTAIVGRLRRLSRKRLVPKRPCTPSPLI